MSWLKSNDMVPSRYFLIARLMPAIVCSVPFFVLYFFFLSYPLGDFFKTLLSVPWLGDVTTGIAFIFLLAFVGRSISKDIFERRWFKSDETRMPTTNFLMHDNSEYSIDFKRLVHEKIKTDFTLEIFPAHEESRNEAGARKRIAEAVLLVRQRVKNGRLVLNHNIEYGFFRNLIGCSVIAVLVSTLNIWIFHAVQPNPLALNTSIVLFILYLIPIATAKLMMDVHGRRYARVLIQEYLTIQ